MSRNKFFLTRAASTNWRRVKRRFLLSFAATFVVIASSAVAETYSVYSVGNSLTEDLNSTLPTLATNYLAPQGRSYSYGYQIRHGSALTFIYDHPIDAITKDNYSSPTNFTVALPNNHWDAVTFQPYYRSSSEPSTLATDTLAIKNLIRLTQTNASNVSTRFYIYSAWPNTSAGDINSYSNRFLAAASSDANQTSLLSRDYIRHLVESVRKSNATISVIPAGEVLYGIDQKMRAGEIPDFTSIRQLYRDDYHLNGLGRNIVGATAYAVIFKENPTGLDYVSVWPDSDAKFMNNMPAKFLDASGILAVNDAAKIAVLKADLKIMQQIAWNIVNHRSY